VLAVELPDPLEPGLVARLDRQQPPVRRRDRLLDRQQQLGANTLPLPGPARGDHEQFAHPVRELLPGEADDADRRAALLVGEDAVAAGGVRGVVLVKHPPDGAQFVRP
jgi:hypothetical protein